MSNNLFTVNDTIQYYKTDNHEYLRNSHVFQSQSGIQRLTKFTSILSLKSTHLLKLLTLFKQNNQKYHFTCLFTKIAHALSRLLFMYSNVKTLWIAGYRWVEW